MTSNPGRLLLVGWDAADWKVIMPLVDAGKMPHTKRLIEGGVCGNMATLQPVLSPMLWTSIATGKRPYKHGVHGFSEPDPVSGGIRPVTNLSRKTKAVWNILNQNGKNSIVVGWWPSHPAEPLTRGVMVSNHYQRVTAPLDKPWPMQPGTVHPERLEKVLGELRFHPGELTEEDLRPFLPGLEGMNREELDAVAKDPRIQSLAKIIADMTSIHSAATALIQNEPWDFMAVYYDAVDHFGHAFMKYHPPRRDHIGEQDFRIFNYCLEAGYLFHDAMLGTLLHLAGEETTVILMSDHGFHPDHLRPLSIPREPAGPAAEHRQFGIFAAIGPGLQKDHTLYGANLLDIAPTILHFFGLPVGEDMDGKVLLDLYEEPAEVERISSWDDVAGEGGCHPPDKVIAPSDSKAALDQLVALGYIEQPDEDRSMALEKTVRELDCNLADAYVDGGVYGEAVVILERLYEKWPMEHRFGFKLANCYRQLGRAAELRALVGMIIERRIAEANAAVEELKALKLDDPEVQEIEKARLEKMTDGEKEKFGRERRELLAKARPNLIALRTFEAQADFAEKKYEHALAKLDRLESDYGARRNALTLRGEICLQMRDWEKADTCFREALEIDPEAPGPHLGLARAALGRQEFGDAAGHALTSIGLLFHQPRAHYLLGVAYYRAGDWENAEHAFLISVRQAPLLAANYRMLSEIARYCKKDIGEAVQYRSFVREALKRRRELAVKKGTEARATAESVRSGEEEAPMPVLLPRPETLAGVPEEEIITVVSGLPRSGTSLMMQMLEAAGIEPFTDAHRTADESNPEGYYEHEQVGALLKEKDKTWLREACGKAIKVVAPLLAALPLRLPVENNVAGGAGNKTSERLHYRVIYMERAMDEILLSQARMLERLDRTPEQSEKATDIGKAYRQQSRHARAVLGRRGIPALEVNYSRLVNEPEGQAAEIAAFLGKEDTAGAMAVRVKPGLYRVRV